MAHEKVARKGVYIILYASRISLHVGKRRKDLIWLVHGY